MAVVTIIGIFSALAIPGIMQVQYRNTLADSVDRVRSAGAAARDLAMQTRQAAVLEVSSTGVWVNLLTDAGCDSGIAKRCTTALGRASDGFIPLFDADGVGREAGVAMCGGSVLTMDSADACTVDTELVVSDGFALCYSGAGDLFYRLGGDAGTVCGVGDPPSASATDWIPACSVATAVSVEFTDESTLALKDGGALMLNRYEGDACSSTTNAMDVRRLVYFPSNGSPYSQTGGEE